MSTETANAEILWAQRSNEFDEEKNIIFFTVNLPNIIGEPELKVEENEITFKAQAGSDAPGLPKPKTYAFTLPLYAAIVPELTKKSLTTRHLQLILRKKEAKEEFWPRITKEKGKNQWIKTDFSKWVDEDEQEEAPAPDQSEYSDMSGGQPGMGGPPGMGGMGGMPGMGGPPGAGGMGGMDMEALMAQMGGGGGGQGGAGGMDFAKLMAQMQAGGAGMPGGMPDLGENGDDEDDEGDDEMPPLEDESAASELDKTD